MPETACGFTFKNSGCFLTETNLSTLGRSGDCGNTGLDGFARMSIPIIGLDDVEGVAPGFYSVEISKPGEEIPAKYNSQTIYGVEIAPDVMRKPPLIFDIGK